jgi:hypothetical protein
MEQDWFKEDMKKYRNRPLNFNDPDAQPRYYRAIADEFATAKTIAFDRLEASDAKFAEELRKLRIIKAEYKAGIYSDEQQPQPSSPPKATALDTILQFR